MRAPTGRWSVFRHIYTSAPENFPGGGGFQTVACASDLGEQQRNAVEKLVDSYSNREGGGAPCRQFLPLARGAKAFALTVFTPLEDCPDGRTGNFWAETQVVPSEWLEQAEWDAAAAFKALSWLGPKNISDISRNLEPEPLDELKSGALDRLGRLNELVSPDCLETLLQAVAQESRGLRPLWLLES